MLPEVTPLPKPAVTGVTYQTTGHPTTDPHHTPANTQQLCSFNDNRQFNSLIGSLTMNVVFVLFSGVKTIYLINVHSAEPLVIYIYLYIWITISNIDALPNVTICKLYYKL